MTARVDEDLGRWVLRGHAAAYNAGPPRPKRHEKGPVTADRPLSVSATSAYFGGVVVVVVVAPVLGVVVLEPSGFVVVVVDEAAGAVAELSVAVVVVLVAAGAAEESVVVVVSAFFVQAPSARLAAASAVAVAIRLVRQVEEFISRLPREKTSVRLFNRGRAGLFPKM